MDAEERKLKIKKAKEAALFLVKRAGPTAAVAIIRRLGWKKVSNVMGAALLVHGVYKEWKDSQEKKGAPPTPPKPDAA